MSALVAECHPKTLRVDESVHPDSDESYIYEHLMYYCSKFDPLPAATVTLRNGLPVVIQGHKYVQSGSALGRQSVRVIITGDVSKEDMRSFLQIEGVKTLDWQSLLREERETSVLDAVHVVFFDEQLSSDQNRLFEEKISGFFSSIAK
jgi:hypothetical protein